MEMDGSRLGERERQQLPSWSHLDPRRQEEAWETKDYQEENCQC